jgi:hypothetical protein
VTVPRPVPTALALLMAVALPAVPAAAAGSDRQWKSTANPAARGVAALRAVTCRSATDVWMAGSGVHPETGREYGIVQHWTGLSWQTPAGAPVAEGADVRLNDVDALPAGGVLAVGWTGSAEHPVPRIEQYPASGAAGVPAPGTEPIAEGAWQGIDIRSASDGWAVGVAGPLGTGASLIARWDGSRWQRVAAPATGGLTAVTARAADDAWAVGTDPGTTHALVLHWDGVTWQRVTVPDPDPEQPVTLLGVTTAGAGDVWAVGYTGVEDRAPTRAVALHLTGGTWQTIRSSRASATQYSDVVAVTPSDVVLGGYQEVFSVENTNIETFDGTTVRPDVTYPDHTNDGLASALSGLAIEPDGAHLWAAGWITTTRQPAEQPAGLRSNH